MRPAPAARAAARLSEPDFPPPPMTATVGASYPPTTRAVSAGAPQTSITERLSAGSRSSGRTAAIERPNSTAYPSQGTCSPAPSQSARPSSITSGVSVSDTSVATRSPTRRPSGDGRADLLDGADEHAAGAGLGVLHLAARGDDVEDRGADRGGVDPAVVAGVGPLELAVRRGVEVEPLDADPDLVGPQVGAGVEALGGLGQDDGVVEDAVETGRIALADRHGGCSSVDSGR